MLATPLWCLPWGGAVEGEGPGWSQSWTEQPGRGQGPGRTLQISGFSNSANEGDSRGKAGLGRALEANLRSKNPSSAIWPRRDPRMYLLKSQSVLPSPSPLLFKTYLLVCFLSLLFL